MLNKKISLSILLTLMTLITVTPAFADGDKVALKIATVDVNRVLNESKEAATKKAQLDAKANAAREKVTAKRKSLKDLEDKLKAENAAEDSKEVKALKDDAKEYSRYIKDTEDSLKEEFMAMNKSLTEKALALIKNYAEEKNYDLVLDKGEQARGPVLYGAKTADITEDVIKGMNR